MAAILERTQPVMGAMWKAFGFDADVHDTAALLDSSMGVSMRLLLTARHEALILTLAATGLPYSQLAALRVCAVAVNPVADALHVETVDGTWTSTPTALIDAGVSPATVPNSPASPESLTASVNQTGPSPVGAAYLPHLQGVTPLGETVARISAEILGLDP